MTSSLNVTRDDFEYWLFRMDDELGLLLQTVPSDLKLRLDYSLESLVDLESYLLEKYQDIGSIRVDSERENLDRYFRYVGEAIRKSAGGVWDIELEDQETAFYRIPIIRSERYGSECPLTLVTASLDRRRGDYIYKIANVLKTRAEARDVR